MRHFQIFKSGAVTDENCNQAHQHTQVPKLAAEGDAPRLRHLVLTEPGHDPKPDAKSGWNREAVGKGRGRDGVNPAVRQARAVGQQVGRVKFQGSQEAKGRRHQQPEGRVAEQHEQRQPARGVNFAGRNGLAAGSG